MDLIIKPQKLSGTVAAISSKSMAHRMLLCAAFSDGPTQLLCPDTSRDIEATAACLTALGASIIRTAQGYRVSPVAAVPRKAELDCGESGSTLRFLLPAVGALGVGGTFHMAGRLPQRPLSPLWEELERMGCRLSRPTPDTVLCQGQLRSGEYVLDGGVSSQYLSGLLMAMPLLPQGGRLTIVGRVESAPYVEMTRQVMALFQVNTEGYRVTEDARYHSPGILPVEGDWSNAAFFLAAAALGSSITVTGLSRCSSQGDKIVETWLPELCCTTPRISVANTPDLVPILAVVAGACHGAVFTDAGRLRLKESDRMASVAAVVNALGGHAEIDGDTLTVAGTGFQGGIVDTVGDHRIGMAAAIAATVCRESVTVRGAECVAKSYPQFWADYRKLGGSYEQYLGR